MKNPVNILAFLFLFSALAPFPLAGQEKPAYTFVNGTRLTVLGRSETVPQGIFHRIDSADLTGLPARVRELSRNSAGINIMFQTNSESIKIKWDLEEYRVLWNMTPLAASGVDLYGWNQKSWQYVASGKPTGEQNEATLIRNLDGKMRHYRIYLPLYTGINHIEVGIETGAEIKPADKAFLPLRKVVVYGSSITQGASASRPGLAWPSIVSRTLGVETFNLGFSGSGKMEIEMAGILGSMAADLFILDCVPNPSPEQIKKRAIPFIKKLRELRPQVPILMVESIFRESGHWDKTIKEKVTKQNKEFNIAYRRLKKEGFENLYYVPSEELTGNDHEATVDGTHLSDTGQTKMARRISRAIKNILHLQ